MLGQDKPLFCLFARSLPCRQPPAPAWKSKTFWSSTSSGKRWADAQEGTGLVNLSLPLSERAASERRKQKSGRHLDTKKQQQQQQQQKYLPQTTNVKTEAIWAHAQRHPPPASARTAGQLRRRQLLREERGRSARPGPRPALLPAGRGGRGPGSPSPPSSPGLARCPGTGRQQLRKRGLDFGETKPAQQHWSPPGVGERIQGGGSSRWPPADRKAQFFNYCLFPLLRINYFSRIFFPY